MREDLRRRRERHLLLVRLGIPFKERCRRLADEFDVSVNAVEKDDTRMDDWIDDVANTASFQKKAAFLLYQHRSQAEGTEQLARNARQERSAAEQRVAELEERINDIERQGPEAFEDEDDYWNTLIRFYRQLDSAESDVFKWQREERQERQAIAEMTQDEFDLRQSLGQIEKAADEIHIKEEREVTERKVIAGFDLADLPGLNEASLVGADMEMEREAAEIALEDDDE